MSHGLRQRPWLSWKCTHQKIKHYYIFWGVHIWMYIFIELFPFLNSQAYALFLQHTWSRLRCTMIQSESSLVFKCCNFLGPVPKSIHLGLLHFTTLRIFHYKYKIFVHNWHFLTFVTLMFISVKSITILVSSTSVMKLTLQFSTGT